MPHRVPDESAEKASVDTARQRLLDAGAADLAAPPWSHPSAPPDDVTLIAFAVWRANRAVGQADREELLAAVRLLDSAHGQVEALESALLLIARAEGLTWPEIAGALGVRSPQAAQQRARRVSTRVSGDDLPGGGR